MYSGVYMCTVVCTVGSCVQWCVYVYSGVCSMAMCTGVCTVGPCVQWCAQ